MLNEKLKNINLILASASPRRQNFFKSLGLDYEIRLKPVNEIYPPQLKGSEISDYLAKLKAIPFINELKENELLITSDTIVWHKNNALGKPKNNDDAFKILSALSNSKHEVITSICFTSISKQIVVNDVTEVTFKVLSKEEILYYISNYQPLDKAGAYGIQEWIGAIGVKHLKGSYNNVMGLPTHLLYETLNTIELEF